MGFASDGVAVFYGKDNGLGVCLSKDIYNDPDQIFRNHCLPHKLNLAARHAVEAVPELEETEGRIKGAANFYNAQNAKNLAHLTALAEAKEERLYRLTYSFDERWEGSAAIVYKRFRHMIPLLILDTEAIAADNSFQDTTQAKAQGLNNGLTDIRFILIVYFVSDILAVLSQFSKVFQKSGGILVGKTTHITNMKKSIKAQLTQDGVYLSQLLEKLECRKEEHSPGFVKCGNVAKVEGAYQVRYKDAKPEYTILLTTPNSRGARRPFSAVRVSIINTLLAELNDYFPDTQYSNFEILNPKTFDREAAQTRMFGLKEIRELSTRFKLDAESVIHEWQEFMYDLSESPDYVVRTADVSATIFWPSMLRGKDFVLGSNLRKLIRIVLVLPASSADVERAFSIFKHIKSTRRTNLSIRTVRGLMRLMLNGPKDPAKFPSASYVQTWKGLHSNQPRSGGGRPIKRPGDTNDPESVQGKRIFTNEVEVVEGNEAEQDAREREEAEIAMEQGAEPDLVYVDYELEEADRNYFDDNTLFY